MKHLTILLLAVILSTAPFTAAAQSAPVDSAFAFKSFDDEVALDVKRETGVVKFLIYIKDASQFNNILIERSAESPNYFGKCRYISTSDMKLTDNRMVEYDRYPYSAAKDVYYRIKTVTKDGVERAYPPVLLAAVRK